GVVPPGHRTGAQALATVLPDVLGRVGLGCSGLTGAVAGVGGHGVLLGVGGADVNTLPRNVDWCKRKAKRRPTPADMTGGGRALLGQPDAFCDVTLLAGGAGCAGGVLRRADPAAPGGVTRGGHRTPAAARRGRWLRTACATCPA